MGRSTRGRRVGRSAKGCRRGRRARTRCLCLGRQYPGVPQYQGNQGAGGHPPGRAGCPLAQPGYSTGQPGSGGRLDAGVSRNLAWMIGPAIAGLLTVSGGGGWANAADAASFFMAAGCFGRMAPTEWRPRPRAPQACSANCGRGGITSVRSRGSGAFGVLNAAYQGIWQVTGPVIAPGTIGAECRALERLLSRGGSFDEFGSSSQYLSVSCRYRSWPRPLAPRRWPPPAGDCRQ